MSGLASGGEFPAGARAGEGSSPRLDSWVMAAVGGDAEEVGGGGRSGFHVPVMVGEVVAGLALAGGGVYVDGTLGEGGHSEAILRAWPAVRLVVGIDLDGRSVDAAAGRLAGYGSRFVGVRGNYADMVGLAGGLGVTEVDGVLLDLGFSSRQVDGVGYGMSFQRDERLDMRFDGDGGLDAGVVVNTFAEGELAEVFWRFGEERGARAVARAIVRERSGGVIGTTGELAGLVERVLGGGRRGGRRGVHPATRVFQALRILVNGELDNLRGGLEGAVGLLRAGGRLAVISYHSLEDRVVKGFLGRGAAVCVCPRGLPVCVCGHRATVEVVNRRVIRPSGEELAANPRSRSGRLRVARRV